MLRITMHDDAQALTFQVEGRLVGEWAKELERAWIDAKKNTKSLRGNRPAIVDLTGILFIDDEGKRILKQLSHEGARFHTCCPMTEAIIAEIGGEPGGRSHGLRWNIG
jgi:hypothetical protein